MCLFDSATCWRIGRKRCSPDTRSTVLWSAWIPTSGCSGPPWWPGGKSDERVTASADAVRSFLTDRPSRSFPRVASRIRLGSVSSTNCTSGSMSSANRTGLCMISPLSFHRERVAPEHVLRHAASQGHRRTARMHRTVSPDPLQQSSDLAGYGCVRSSSNVQARCGESDRCSRHAWTERGVGQPESLVQCSRKRRRCHRRTVSGVTITRECLHPAQTLASPTQKSRSVVRSFGRVTDLLYTANCWCRARFSRASWRWPPQRNGTSRRRWSRKGGVSPRRPASPGLIPRYALEWCSLVHHGVV